MVSVGDEENMKSNDKFSVLFGDRKGIWPHKRCISYSVIMQLHSFLPLFFPPHHPFSCLRRTLWDCIKEAVIWSVLRGYTGPEYYWRWRGKGAITQVRLE